MTFVNPLFLIGIVAAGVPVLIHLVRREEKARTVFPATSLLRSSAEVVSRRRNVAELVLLALRVLLVVAFVLALARPRVRGLRVAGERKVLASVAIVVDDTPSMGARITTKTPRTPRTSGRQGALVSHDPRGLGGTRMDEARRVVLAVLDGLEPGSRVRLETATRVLLDGEVDLAEARRAVEKLRAGDVAKGLPGALARSVDWLRDELPPREIYVISDFQRSSWEGARGLPVWSDARGHFVDLGAAGTSYVKTVRLLSEPPSPPGKPAEGGLGAGEAGERSWHSARGRTDGAGALRDWGVSGVRTVEDRVFRGVPFEIRSRVRASYTGERELALTLGGRLVRRKKVRLLAGDSTEVPFEVALPDAGPVAGEFRLAGTDDWAGDDSRAFALEVLPPPEVLCVGAPSGEGKLAGDLVALAFSPFPAGERELARVRKTQPPLPERRELERFDCAVLASPSALPESDWPLLARFVEDGGGLLAFADEGMGAASGKDETGFWRRTRGLLPATGAGLRARGEPSRLVGLEYDHPVLASFADGANGEIGLASFRRTLGLTLPLPQRAQRSQSVWPSVSSVAHSGEGEGGLRTLAYFSGSGRRSPALVASSRGRGRVLLFGVGLSRTWGTFYRDPCFVPFVHEAVAHLARADPALRTVLAGERATVGLTPLERGRAARIEDRAKKPPAVRTLEVDPEDMVVRLGPMRRRGVFHVVTRPAPGGPGPERTRALAVEIDPRELDQERVAPGKLLGIASVGGASAAELGTAVARSRGGADASACFLGAALVVLVAEMLLSWYLTRRRSGALGQGRNARGAI